MGLRRVQWSIAGARRRACQRTPSLSMRAVSPAPVPTALRRTACRLRGSARPRPPLAGRSATDGLASPDPTPPGSLMCCNAKACNGGVAATLPATSSPPSWSATSASGQHPGSPYPAIVGRCGIATGPVRAWALPAGCVSRMSASATSTSVATSTEHSESASDPTSVAQSTCMGGVELMLGAAGAVSLIQTMETTGFGLA